MVPTTLSHVMALANCQGNIEALLAIQQVFGKHLGRVAIPIENAVADLLAAKKEDYKTLASQIPVKELGIVLADYGE